MINVLIWKCLSWKRKLFCQEMTKRAMVCLSWIAPPSKKSCGLQMLPNTGSDMTLYPNCSSFYLLCSHGLCGLRQNDFGRDLEGIVEPESQWTVPLTVTDQKGIPCNSKSKHLGGMENHHSKLWNHPLTLVHFYTNRLLAWSVINSFTHNTTLKCLYYYMSRVTCTLLIPSVTIPNFPEKQLTLKSLMSFP